MEPQYYYRLRIELIFWAQFLLTSRSHWVIINCRISNQRVCLSSLENEGADEAVDFQ